MGAAPVIPPGSFSASGGRPRRRARSRATPERFNVQHAGPPSRPNGPDDNESRATCAYTCAPRVTASNEPAVPGAPVRGVAIIYNVIRSVPIAQLHEPHPPDDRLYIDAHGLMHMCAVCRRVRRGDAPGHRWDFVPAYVEQPRKNTSHGFCGTCFGIKYGAPKLAL